MIKAYLRSIVKDFILSWKIASIVSIFMIICFCIQIFVENDTSIQSFVKGLVLSFTILNLSLILLAFKCEEELNFGYISQFFDLTEKHRLISRYLFFLIINLLLLFAYIILNIEFLLFGFLINIVICSVVLFAYYIFGSSYLVMLMLIITGLTILTLQIIPISFSFINDLHSIIPLLGILIYIFSLLSSLVILHFKRRII
jgi:hypothetical protein